MQVSRLSLGDMVVVRLQRSADFGRGELLDLLRSTSDESAGVKECVQLIDDRVEELGTTDTLDQVVVSTVFLDIVRGLVGEDTYQ